MYATCQSYQKVHNCQKLKVSQLAKTKTWEEWKRNGEEKEKERREKRKGKTAFQLVSEKESS